MPRQFENAEQPARARADHRGRDLEATAGKLDAFVAGVGTGGTLTGVARGLRGRGLSIEVYAVEPKASAVLSGGQPGLHGIQGLGAGFVPKVLQMSLIDDVIAVLGSRRRTHDCTVVPRRRSVRRSVVGRERARSGEGRKSNAFRRSELLPSSATPVSAIRSDSAGEARSIRTQRAPAWLLLCFAVCGAPVLHALPAKAQCIDEAIRDELNARRRYRGVQKRLFQKTGRHEISGMAGVYAADLLSASYLLQGAYTFHVSEDFALEASFGVHARGVRSRAHRRAGHELHRAAARYARVHLPRPPLVVARLRQAALVQRVDLALRSVRRARRAA